MTRASLSVGLLVAASALAGCGEPSGAVEAKSKATPALAVTVAPVEVRAVQRTVDATGSLLAWQEVILNTPVRGTVAKILVDLGDRVEAGQVIAQLDPRELALGVEQADAGVGAARDGLLRARAQTEAAQAQLQQVRDGRRSFEANISRAAAALEETRVNLERMRTLVQESLVAQREVDVARTQYETMRAAHETAQVEMSQYPSRVRAAEAEVASTVSAVRVAEADLRRREADLALARKRLTDATITSPIRGAIARRHLNPGQFVVEDTPVFTIVQTDPLKFSGTVPEHAALEVKPGQLVRLRAELADTRAFTGRVTRVSPAVEVASRTVLVEAEVPNPDGRLKPGLFARGAAVIREDRDVTFVPEAAVSYFAGLTRVFVVADGTASQRPVTLGTRMDGFIEIVKGVRPGEQVATSRLAQLQDGAAVTTAAPPARPAARPPGSG
ncbi:MAG TPA: efflux RND transporter periplasmic adaptor subunit [Candidatus Limnocylindria bacterium]|nr:efflux RND transporter periplasmic adaptor subunit [Candidatus Limnocylindria bacterium]